MAASTVYSSLFTSATSGVPVAGRPKTAPVGINADLAIYTIATTSLDDVGDFVGLIPLSPGKTLFELRIKSPTDLDSGTNTLDGDIVLRQTDKNGVNTDTIVYDASANSPFTAAITLTSVFPNQFISGAADADDVVVLGFKVNTAANVPVSGVITVFVLFG